MNSWSFTTNIKIDQIDQIDLTKKETTKIMERKDKAIIKVEEIGTMVKDGTIIGDIEKEDPIIDKMKTLITTIKEDQEDSEIEEIFTKLEETDHELK